MVPEIEYQIILASIAIFLYSFETVWPYQQFSCQNKKDFARSKCVVHTEKIIHALRNGGVALINALAAQIVFVPLLLIATNTTIGIFHFYNVLPIVELALTVLFIDLLTYALHFSFHKQPFLWRFHRMHHSDAHMDVTSAVRFHLGEITVSFTARLLLFVALGARIEFIVLYELLFLANVLFHHANISLPERVDKCYRIFFTSPRMHKVHHSIHKCEADANYTSLFSFWDRIFGTFLLLPPGRVITYGITGFGAKQQLHELLATPWKKPLEKKKK